MGQPLPASVHQLTDTDFARICAGLASIGAAAVHLLLTGDHMEEWRLAGLFFAAITMFQAGWGVAAIMSRRRLLMVVGILANAGSVALWAVSRTAGMPVGPAAGVAELASSADVLTVVLELVVCAGAAWSLRRPVREVRAAAHTCSVLGLAGAAILVFTVPALDSALAGHSHGPGDQHAPADPNMEDGSHSHTPEPGTTPNPKPTIKTKTPKPTHTHNHPHDRDA